MKSLQLQGMEGNNVIGEREMSFSVLMSVYEKEKPVYLKESLASILNQTMQPDEIVLVADGPLTDELEKVIRQFQKKTEALNVVRLTENQQLGRALECGLEKCSNELVARMDTDDIALPGRFEKQYLYMMQHPDVDVLGGLIEEFDPEDDGYRKIKHMPIDSEGIIKYSRYRNPVNHMTVMFRRGKVEDAGGYRHFPFLEDYDLWTRMLVLKCQFANLDEVLVRARTERNIYTRRGGFKYCKQYLKLRKQQKEFGLINIKEYMVAIILTVAMTLQPSCLRKTMYQKMLRR